MNAPRARLAAALLTTCVAAALTVAVPAAPTAAGTAARTPAPDAPHRGTVTLARDPGRSPAPGRERAVRAFAEGRRARAGAAADLTHNWWGVFPQPGTHDGIMATHSVDPAYRVTDSENFTYAPTTKAQKSCMEVVTAYWDTGTELWAWDWCSSPGGPAKVLPVDAEFLSTYTTDATGRPAYSVQMVQDDASANRWSAYLFNHRTAGWDLLFRQSGKDLSELEHGWDMFEIYASVNPSTGVGYYCTEARSTVFDSGAVQLRSKGTWKPARPADSPWTEDRPDGRDFLCPPLRFVQAGANDHWTVRQ
ncbi:carbohydrate-binding protein [Streptomyces sp. ISL-11]|uniref:carbohydrate-binding protein n=1 Tax=Streptomyces sp. ISL-11 TaxID=2819174 RepID=UPI002035CCC5|nr:carbohydrate-binding protein [Streptomyces sp. ISL-11]